MGLVNVEHTTTMLLLQVAPEIAHDAGSEAWPVDSGIGNPGSHSRSANGGIPQGCSRRRCRLLSVLRLPSTAGTTLESPVLSHLVLSKHGSEYMFDRFCMLWRRNHVLGPFRA